MSKQRLLFIDAIRGLAILLMLEGHFVDSLLKLPHKDYTSYIYLNWLFLRGITAPLFYTITGVIFVYLLQKNKQRISKGFKRSLELICIGYLLRIPISSWLIGDFTSSYFLIVDVLQCIGISIIVLICFYLICFKNSVFYFSLLFIFGCSSFMFESTILSLNTNHIPVVFANYITLNNGSIFTIIPWIGYVCFGGCIGVILHNATRNFNYFTQSILFFITGLLLVLFSSKLFLYSYNKFHVELFKSIAYNNYLFIRLGHVLLIFSVFMLFENLWKRSCLTQITH